MNEWMNEWMSVQCVLHYNFSLIQLTFRIVMLHEWMNEWMNEWMSLQCVLHYNVLPKEMSIYVFYFITLLLHIFVLINILFL